MKKIEKQQDKIFDKKYREQKKTLDKKFDVLNVINTTYADSSEYDLNDALIYLNRVISQTKTKSRELVKANFNKFVECRIVLEEILDNMKSNNLHKDTSKVVFDNLKIIRSKFKPVDTEEDSKRERKIMILNKFKTLFNIKTLLITNFSNIENFAKIYKEGKQQYEELKNSKIVQKIWDSIKQTKIDFLEKLYKNISHECLNFEEVLYNFNIYFEIDEQKTDRKIMNTLLVNFKNKCLDSNYKDKNMFLTETFYFYLRTLYHLDKELQKEITIYLFDKVKLILKISSLEFAKIWLSRFKNQTPKQLELEVLSVYNLNLKSIKKFIIETFLDSTNLHEIYLKLEEMLDEEDMKTLKNKLISVLEKQSEKIEFENSEDISNFFKSISVFEKYFKKDKDALFILKKKIISKELKKQIRILSNKLIEKTTSRYKKLMDVLKIIDRLPDFYEIILKGVLPVLDKDVILLYYVTHVLNQDAPELNNVQKSEVESLIPQFGYLLKSNQHYAD